MSPTRKQYTTMLTTAPWGYMVLDEDGEPVEIFDRGEKTRLVFAELRVADSLAAALTIGAAAIDAGAIAEEGGDDG